MKEVFDFGIKLKNLREMKGESQTELAKVLDVSPQMVSKLENGKSQPTAATLTKLAEHFKTSVDEMLGIKNNAFSKENSLPIIGTVSAGKPIMVIENIIGYYPKLPGEKGEFYLRVSGNSMEPTIQRGALVLIKKSRTISSGAIGIVILNGDHGVLKRIYFDPYGVILRSDNNSYAPIFITKERWENESMLIGVVTLTVRNMETEI